MFSVYENTYDSAVLNVASGDTCTEFLKIPGGSWVLGVMLEVLTAQATVTVDVGDVTDPNGFVAAQATTATGKFAGGGAYVAATTDTTALRIPKFYAADTWLSFSVGGATASAAKFRVAVAVANAG
jgi:hypothetical protein